jgi:hypothetical protein
MKKQKRVGAISSIKDGKMELFGYGVYEGDKIPETDNVKFFGTSLKELNISNPCILLDSGERVYGCECWWASEKQVKEMEKECHIVEIVPINEIRK